jgi:hypothetical protein
MSDNWHSVELKWLKLVFNHYHLSHLRNIALLFYLRSSANKIARENVIFCNIKVLRLLAEVYLTVSSKVEEKYISIKRIELSPTISNDPPELPLSPKSKV